MIIRLPIKRTRPKMGVREPVRREFQRHRKFVRAFGCSVPLCTTGQPIEFAHIRSAANAGTGLRPHDAFGISLCSQHHREQHQIGQPAFERKYQIDLRGIAAAFVRASPDKALKDSLKLVQPGAER